MHEKFDVEGFTFGHFQTIWYAKQMAAFPLLKASNKIISLLKKNEYPELKQPLIEKLEINESERFDIYLNPEARLAKAKEQAIEILDVIEKNLEENQFALSTDGYTLADVLMTSLLVRLSFSAEFFEKEV